MKFETEMCRIAFKYHTDKCPQLRHSYTPFYYKFFKDRKAVKKVLEIGIGIIPQRNNLQGASLHMWRDFFPNAHIYGIDIDKTNIFQEERISTFLMDQRRRNSWNKLIKRIGKDIDIVIDDGSHIKTNQVRTCRILKPLLKKNVIYIIEDVKYSDYIISKLPQYDIKLYKFKESLRDDNLAIVYDKS